MSAQPIAVVEPVPHLEVVSGSFSLSREVNRIIDEDKLVDPREIAAEVIGLVPLDQRDQLLQHLLASAVRQVIHNRRSKNVAEKQGHQKGSPRWGEASEMLDRKLNTPVWTGEHHKAHRDCTEQDLLGAVRNHEAVASQNAAMAERYMAQARAMKKAKVQRFGDLPADKLRELLS